MTPVGSPCNNLKYINYISSIKPDAHLTRAEIDGNRWRHRQPARVHPLAVLTLPELRRHRADLRLGHQLGKSLTKGHRGEGREEGTGKWGLVTSLVLKPPFI